MTLTQNEIWKDRHARHLEAQVEAVNKANAEANRLQRLFIEAFRPFVGKKILTHGGLAQQPKQVVDSLLPPWKADGYTTPTTYRNSSTYTLSFTVKIWIAKGDTGSYHEATFYVGDLDGYNLKNVFEETKDRIALRTDYTVEEVRRLRRELDDAEKAFRAAQSKLSPFGRYDQ